MTYAMFRISPLLIVLLFASTSAKGDDFFLKGGETVLFFGDSITQSGQYINYVEAYLLTRFPERMFRLINHGISSETISGTSETDHDPRRPWAHERFDRDVAAWKPDVVVACFGMNDGNYHSFEPVRFGKYQQGVRRLIDRTQNVQAKLVLMTPPPFDPYRRRASDSDAVEYGYKFPAIDYDETLAQYSRWLLTLRRPEQLVVDQHGTTNEHLRRRREQRVSFFLAGDAVHPNATGHWLMAQHLLLAWNAPAVASEATIDAAASEVKTGDVSDLRREGTGLSFAWRTPLPLPLDPDWDAESLALERVADRLNRHRLTVTGLNPGRYRLLADSRSVTEVGSEDLARGLDLTTLPEFPTNQQSGELLTLVKERRTLQYRLWRNEIGRPVGQPTEADNRRIDEIGTRLDELRRPLTVQVRLEMVEASD